MTSTSKHGPPVLSHQHHFFHFMPLANHDLSQWTHFGCGTCGLSAQERVCEGRVDQRRGVRGPRGLLGVLASRVRLAGPGLHRVPLNCWALEGCVPAPCVGECGGWIARRPCVGESSQCNPGVIGLGEKLI